MNKLLYIVGGTATGKTDLALALAKKLNGDLISIDSRQIYVGMDIGTGKDIPASFEKKSVDIHTLNNQTIYSDGHTNIWGYDRVDPSEKYSIALFKKNVDQIIDYLHSKEKLPIIVGGSGLYASVIENPPQSISISMDKILRKKLSQKSVTELKEILKEVSSQKFNQLNHSDLHNPRRLVRAIEVAKHQTKNNNATIKLETKSFNSLWIGLKSHLNTKKISQRVEVRIKQGFEKECQKLYSNGNLNIKYQSSSATGYSQWLKYKQGEYSKEEYVKKWIKAEEQYAKRQNTWFKSQDQIEWLDAESINYPKSVVQKVQVWYS